jgi:hypothetical protein
MGPTRFSETSVNSYHTTPRNIPEEFRSQVKLSLLWANMIAKRNCATPASESVQYVTCRIIWLGKGFGPTAIKVTGIAWATKHCHILGMKASLYVVQLRVYRDVMFHTSHALRERGGSSGHFTKLLLYVLATYRHKGAALLSTRHDFSACAPGANVNTLGLPPDTSSIARVCHYRWQCKFPRLTTKYLSPEAFTVAEICGIISGDQSR